VEKKAQRHKAGRATKSPKSKRPTASVAPSRGSQSKSFSKLTLPEWGVVVGIIVLSILCLVAVGKQGQRKGQSFWLGFNFALFVSPLLVSLIFAFLRPITSSEELAKYQRGTWWWRAILLLIYCMPFLFFIGFFLILFLAFKAMTSPSTFNLLKGWGIIK
jgi:hypothetical protein